MATARKKAAAYSDEPSLKEAMNSIHRDKWLEAMQDELASLTENGVYEQVVGSIQYIACVTLPDLALAAHSLARHMSASSKEHWWAAQHVMRCLQKAVNLGLQFSASKGYSVA